MLSNKRIGVIAIVLVVILCITVGCKATEKQGEINGELLEDEDMPIIPEDTEDDNLRETLVYYQDNGGYLVPVMRKIPWEEGIAKATLKKMMDTDEQKQDLMAMGLNALLPADTEINGLTIKDGLAKLDLSKEAMEFNDAVSENNMVQGVVLTLTEFSTIDKVQFLFDGKVIDKLKYGTDVSKPIEPQDVNLELSTSASIGGTKVIVFFHSSPVGNYDYLVPVTRITSEDSASIEAAIQTMLEGPNDDSLMMDIPVGTRLLGVQMDKGITYINFSDEFKDLSQLPQSEPLVLKSIIMTVKQFPGVEEVKILTEGKEYEGVETISVSAFANEY
jgi:germination protein M